METPKADAFSEAISVHGVGAEVHKQTGARFWETLITRNGGLGDQSMSRSQVVGLPYGQGSLKAKLQSSELLSVALPRRVTVAPDPVRELRRALRNPIGSERLQDVTEGAKTVTLIVNDSTRPTPTWAMLPAVLEQLESSRVAGTTIQLLVATGLHRVPTRGELEAMLGAHVTNSLSVLNHDAFDPEQLTYSGETTHGTPIWLSRRVPESDAVISLGYIEPHFFAGYTGGSKMILPGVAGVQSIMANHGARMIDDPRARAGSLEGNPIHEDNVEAAREAGLRFILDVTLNHQKGLARAFAGEPDKAHREGARFTDRFVRVKAPMADVVVTSNSGYPLDRDLYQAVKGMAVAEPVVKEGGLIVVASECRDGIAHPNFERIVGEARNPEELLEKIRDPRFSEIDQWEAQILARVLSRAKVIMVTKAISRDELARMHLELAESVEDALTYARNVLGRRPDVTVIPDGPHVIAEAATGL